MERSYARAESTSFCHGRLEAGRGGEEQELPSKLRPATAEDVKVGQIFWFPHRAGKIPFIPLWTMVEELYDSRSRFYSNDGDCCEITSAYVEEKD